MLTCEYKKQEKQIIFQPSVTSKEKAHLVFKKKACVII